MSDEQGRAQSAKELLRTIIESIGIEKTLELTGVACYELGQVYGGGWRELAWEKARGIIAEAEAKVKKIDGIV